MHTIRSLCPRRNPEPKPEARKPEQNLTSHVLLCKKALTLPLARLRWAEYHWFVLIGLVPAWAFRAPGRSRRRDGFR